MSSQPAQLTLFARAVMAHLRLWPALRLALSNSEIQLSGSPLQLFASEVLELFSSSKPAAGPDQDDVEDLLVQVMDEEFDTFVEDESQVSVARSLMLAWRGLSDAGADERVLALEVEADKVMGTKVAGEQREEVEEESEGDEDTGDAEADAMEVDEAPKLVERPPREEPQVDEDGFTLVQKKRHR